MWVFKMDSFTKIFCMFSITKEEISSLMEIADKNGDGSVPIIRFLVSNLFWACLGLLPERSFLVDKMTHKQKEELI